MRLYVASSWRNTRLDEVIPYLEAVGHEVFDFRRATGFAWQEIDSEWQQWSMSAYLQALEHPRAAEGFHSDMEGLRWADGVVLIQPCGRSAHLELGWAVGANKWTAILLAEGQEPELMVKMVDLIAPTVPALLAGLRAREKRL